MGQVPGGEQPLCFLLHDSLLLHRVQRKANFVLVTMMKQFHPIHPMQIRGICNPSTRVLLQLQCVQGTRRAFGASAMR